MLISTPARPLRLARTAPRAAAVETTAEALADPAARARVRSSSVEIHPDFTLAFVEFDDQGRFWSRDQIDLLERTLEAANRSPDTSGVNVILFAHGWRHDADVCDSNVSCFRTFLTQIRSDMDVSARVSGGRVRPKRIVAIYAGWRGLSAKVQPLELLSFWGRKRVAQRIANEDFVELLTRVELFVERANADDPVRARFSVIGHSFGGTMVFTALNNILKSRALEAAQHQDSPDGRQSVIRGFGNLVVLINPAFEASLYAPLNEIVSGFRRFSPHQTPVLLTIASETDQPNRMWFPLGRRVETLFESTGDRSPRQQIVTAVGNASEFWTHRLTAGSPPRRPGGNEDAFGTVKKDCACELSLEPIDEREVGYLTSLLLGRGAETASAGAETAYGRATLTAVRPIDPRNPFWVVRASGDVIHGHNGIFTTYLTDFVRRVIIQSSAGTRPPS